MSVFHEIKRNVSSAASAATKKTNELTEIAKLTMSIKSEQGKLGECYKEIGRLFYTAERNGEDHTSDIAARIMQADKIKAAIAKYEAEIARVKKIIICDNCAAEVSENSVYCNMCGTKLTKKTAEEECCCGCEDECCCEEAPCECEEACSCCEEEKNDEAAE